MLSPLYLRRSSCFLALVIFWCVLSYADVVDPLFLPSPTRVLGALFIMLQEEGFWEDVVVSGYRVLAGFSVSSAFAVPLGIGMANWKGLDDAFRPFLAFTRYLPVSAFIPLLILWTGIGFAQKMWVIFLGVFFHLAILVADDASRVPRPFLDTAVTLRASRWQVATKVRLPYALPAIIDDMRLMLGAAWTYLVVAELVAADSGIGNMMIESQRFLRTDRVMVGVLVVGLIGLSSDRLFKALGRFFTPWSKFL